MNQLAYFLFEMLFYVVVAVVAAIVVWQVSDESQLPSLVGGATVLVIVLVTRAVQTALQVRRWNALRDVINDPIFHPKEGTVVAEKKKAVPPRRISTNFDNEPTAAPSPEFHGSSPSKRRPVGEDVDIEECNSPFDLALAKEEEAKREREEKAKQQEDQADFDRRVGFLWSAEEKALFEHVLRSKKRDEESAAFLPHHLASSTNINEASPSSVAGSVKSRKMSGPMKFEGSLMVPQSPQPAALIVPGAAGGDIGLLGSSGLAAVGSPRLHAGGPPEFALPRSATVGVGSPPGDLAENSLLGDSSLNILRAETAASVNASSPLSDGHRHRSAVSPPPQRGSSDVLTPIKTNMSTPKASPLPPIRRKASPAGAASRASASPSGQGHFKPTVWDTVARSMRHEGTVVAFQLNLASVIGSEEDQISDAEMEIYLSAASNAIAAAQAVVANTGGVVHSFTLSTLIATFNVQRPCSDHTRAAVYCSLLMAQDIDPIVNEELQCSWGIGVAEGNFVAGHTGSSDLRAYVVHGSGLTMAQNLAHLNDNLYTRVLLSQGVQDEVCADFFTLLVDFVESPRGGGGPCAVFELRGTSDVDRQFFGDDENVRQYLAVWSLLKQGDIMGAKRQASELSPELIRHDIQAARLCRLVQNLFLHPEGVSSSSTKPSFSDRGSPLPVSSPMSPCRNRRPYVRALQPRWDAVEQRAKLAHANRVAQHGVSNGSMTGLGEELNNGSTTSASSLLSPLRQPSELRLSHRAKSQSQQYHLLSESPTRMLEAITRAQSEVYGKSPDLSLSVTLPQALQVDVLEASHNEHNRIPLEDIHSPLHASSRLSGTRGASMETELDDFEVDEFANISRKFFDINDNMWKQSGKRLGTGAFGEVFLGMRADDGKLVAMKVMEIPVPPPSSNNTSTGASPSSQVSPGIFRRRGREDPAKKAEEKINALKEEVRMLCELRHDNIVSFLGCGVDKTDLFLIMEYVSGGSLRSVLDEFGPLPTAAVQRYTKDVLRGLQYLHSKGVVHRDVKPENILLHVNGHCKVTDFGSTIKMNIIQETNKVVGTALYMAPEQARGSKTTCQQSDLWSVGLTVLVLLTGKPPYDINEWGWESRLLYNLARDPTFRPVIPDSIPSQAYDFIAICLQEEPVKRTSAAELLMHPFLITAVDPTPIRHSVSRGNLRRGPSHSGSDPSATPESPSSPAVPRRAKVGSGIGAEGDPLHDQHLHPGVSPVPLSHPLSEIS